MSILGIISSVYAQSDTSTCEGLDCIGNIKQPSVGFTGDFAGLVTTLVTLGIAFGALAALTSILIGGFNFITARDDAEKAEGARKTITNGVIGLIIVASAFIIFKLLSNILSLQSILGG